MSLEGFEFNFKNINLKHFKRFLNTFNKSNQIKQFQELILQIFKTKKPPNLNQ